MCQCQYSIIRAPRATIAHATWRHWPSKAGKFIAEPPMEPAFVSVTRNGSCREEYIRSALQKMLHVPDVVHPWGACVAAGTASASCIA